MKTLREILGIGMLATLPFFGSCAMPSLQRYKACETQRTEQIEDNKNNLEKKIIDREEKNKEIIEKPEEQKFLEPYLGFNALEFFGARNEATKESYLRNRLYAEAGLKIWNLDLSYSSTQDLDNLDHARYFGRHVPGIGLRDWNQRVVGVVKTTDREVLDAKVGIRDIWIPGKIGYGYLDVSFDEEAGNITFLLGRNFGEKFFLEVYNDTEFPFHGCRIIQYNELQPGYRITEKIDLTARVEIPDFCFGEGIYMIGARINFPSLEGK